MWHILNFYSSLQQNLQLLLMNFCSKMCLKFSKKSAYEAETWKWHFYFASMDFFGTNLEPPTGTDFINKKFTIQQKVINIKIRFSSKNDIDLRIC